MGLSLSPFLLHTSASDQVHKDCLNFHSLRLLSMAGTNSTRVQSSAKSSQETLIPKRQDGVMESGGEKDKISNGKRRHKG